MEKPSHKVYLELGSTIEKLLRVFTRDCKDMNDKCLLRHNISIDAETFSKVSQYIQIISTGENIYDIIGQFNAFWAIALYSFNPIVYKDSVKIYDLLSLLSLVGYGCQTLQDPFLLISSLNVILEHIELKLETLSIIAQIVEGLTQCYEKIHDYNATYPELLYTSYKSEIINCDFLTIDETEESKIFYLDEKKSILQVNKMIYYSPNLRILHCTVKPKSLENFGKTYFLGIVALKEMETLWRVQLKLDIKYTKRQALFAWKNGQWNRLDSGQLTEDIAIVSFNKSMSLYVTSETSENIILDPVNKNKKSPLFVYILLGGTSAMLIICVIMVIKNFSSQLNKSAIFRKEPEELSAIELHDENQLDDH